MCLCVSGITWYCILLHWYYTILHGIAYCYTRYYTVPDIAYCYTGITLVLHGIKYCYIGYYTVPNMVDSLKW